MPVDLCINFTCFNFYHHCDIYGSHGIIQSHGRGNSTSLMDNTLLNRVLVSSAHSYGVDILHGGFVDVKFVAFRVSYGTFTFGAVRTRLPRAWTRGSSAVSGDFRCQHHPGILESVLRALLPAAGCFL